MEEEVVGRWQTESMQMSGGGGRVGGEGGKSVCMREPWKQDEGQRDRSIVCRAPNGKGLDGKKLNGDDKAGWRGLPKW